MSNHYDDMMRQNSQIRDLIDKQFEREHREKNPVIDVCEALKGYIQTFEASLDEEHEVGARLVNFGQSISFHINQLGFSKPNIVTFHGVTETGEIVQLIQHVSQLSVLLVAMKRVTNEPKRTIGFIWN